MQFSDIFLKLWNAGLIQKGIWETVYMTGLATAISYVLGLPLGVILNVTDRGGLHPVPWLNRLLGLVVNFFRSIPFIVLMVSMLPVAKFIVGSSLGNAAMIVMLVIAAAPYIARMVESSLKEVDAGVIEAAQAMGCSNLQIVCKVLLPEAKPSLITGGIISMVTILGYSAMAATIGGTGLGQIAIVYGHQRSKPDVTWVCVLLLVLIVQIIQAVGNVIVHRSDKRIRVGASSTPHAEVLELVKDQLAEEGYDLQIVIYDDYILPNKALEDGDLDANYFQHTPYLNSFNESNGTHLVSVGKIHYEPFGIYGQGIDDLADLPEGATIIIPGDDSNGTRALLLLAQEGLITLPEDASVDNGVTVLDVVDDGGYKISAVNAETIAAQLKNSNDGTIGVINYNYALAGGFHIADALAIEDASGDAAQTYGNIVAVKEGNEENPAILALVSALQNGAVDAFNAATGAEIVAVK